MKVLIFSTYFLPVIGGVQTYVNLLAHGLSKWEFAGGEHIEVRVATETPGSTAEDATFPFRVIRHPSFGELKRLVGWADVVHLAGPSLLPMALAWVTRKPFTIEQHGYQAICPNGLLFLQPEKSPCPGYFLAKQYGRCVECESTKMSKAKAIRSLLLTFPRHWLCNRAAANIAITDHVKARLGLNRTTTIYYGIENAPASAATPSMPRDRLTLAYVGRLVDEKGLPLLLRAARRLKDDRVAFRLLFVGDGPRRGDLAATTAELEIEEYVAFTGDLRGQALAEALQDVSVVVMPSIWEETAGLSAIEQMMRGGVVIAADIGGLGEVVGDGGLKFSMGDWEGLASCIRSLAEDPSRIPALGAAARSRAQEKFLIDRMIREHTRIFTECALDAGAGK